MAGGKLTPRQKMVNLMYLVFIAMLALNMSKEVLTAFGNFNEKFAESNTLADNSNQKLIATLDLKASEAKEKYGLPAKMAKNISSVSKEFNNYLESLKTEVKDGVEIDPETGRLPFEQMDKSTIDEKWFQGDGYSPKGKEIVAKIEGYVADVKKILGKDVKYNSFIASLEKRFSTADIKDREGVDKKFLDYKCKGFPAVSTLTFLTAMQNDVKNTESGAYNLFLGNSLEEAASMKNFQAMVILDKNAYFQGEKVTGKVVLGRYDENTVPTSLNVNGRPGNIEKGQALIAETAGSVGEHTLNGKFTFMEDGEEIPLEFTGQYVVVPRPNSASISADKMNVVYRGIDNPISVTFAGISADKVSASAPGMRSAGGKGKYTISPSGTEVVITATGTLPDGSKVSDKKKFRVKGLPNPTGKVRSETSAKGSAGSLAKSTVTAALEDFDFPVTVNVTEFTVSVPGQPTIRVSGSRMNGQAQSAINKAKRGDVIVIDNIKTTFTGINQRARSTSAATFEIQ